MQSLDRRIENRKGVLSHSPPFSSFFKFFYLPLTCSPALFLLLFCFPFIFCCPTLPISCFSFFLNLSPLLSLAWQYFPPPLFTPPSSSPSCSVVLWSLLILSSPQRLYRLTWDTRDLSPFSPSFSVFLSCLHLLSSSLFFLSHTSYSPTIFSHFPLLHSPSYVSFSFWLLSAVEIATFRNSILQNVTAFTCGLLSCVIIWNVRMKKSVEYRMM